jgi:hypothetical protein
MCSHAASATFTRKSRLGIDANRYYVKTVKTNSAASSLRLSLNSGDSILRSGADDSNRHTHSTDDGSRRGRRKRKRRKLRAIHFPVDARDTERREGPSDSDETGC